MEQKDLICMASEAGLGRLLTGADLPTMWHGADLGMLARFADLVAAAERQACATRVAGIRQRVETLDPIEPVPDLSTIDWLRVAESAVRSNG